MRRCAQLGVASPKQQPCNHGLVEAKIEIGNRIKPLELFHWTTDELESRGPIREETLLYYIKQARLAEDDSAMISDMIAMVDDSVRRLAANGFRQILPRERIEEFSAELSEYFWFRMLDPTDAIADQALVSFPSVVVKFGRKILKRERRQNRRLVSLDSDSRGKQAYCRSTPDRVSPPDAILLREVLHLFTPEHQRVFISLYYLGLTVSEIARAENCTRQTIYNRLRTANNKLRQLLV